jgi:hypothetical protein
MPSKKIISDAYTIKAPAVTIEGNLTITGTQTSIQSIDSTIKDRLITLNEGSVGAGVIGGDGTSGIEIDRGILPNKAFLKFRESDDKWIVDQGDGVVRFVLTSTTTVATGLTEVVEDTSPELGGNLEINGFTITDSLANVVVYAGTVGGGDSGVYVDNSEGTERELITKRKAVVYALIF